MLVATPLPPQAFAGLTGPSVGTSLVPPSQPTTQQHHSSHGSGTSSPHPPPAATASTSAGVGVANRTISHRPAVFDKLEQLVRDMQDDDHGVPVRSQKLFLTSIPAAFMGYDLIEWLMDRLSIEDSLEAVHLANLLCQFGYYFPVQELKNLIVKDDSSLYRFQIPYYWPSQHHTPDNVEYAIYLAKRSQRNRQKHGLEDYEVEAYNNLKKILTSKWDFVTMQAEEQLRLYKDRKRGDKIVTDSQEKAYWRVYRPPPGFTTVVESSPVPTREQRIKARSRTREHLTEELVFLRNYSLNIRAKVSQVAESLIDFTEDFYEFDAVLNPNSVGPSNPWITDDQSYWILNQNIVECPTEKRVRKWSMSLEDLIMDPQGVLELMAYMKREYSHENLRFWLSVQELRTGPGKEEKIRKKVKEIWDEFLSPGAKAEINIDGKTMEATRLAMKCPSRYTYEVAANHVYNLLLKKDCYPRFIRSDHYKALAANSVNPGNQKKRFPFTFAVKKKPSSAQNTSGGQPGVNPGQVVYNPKAGLEGCNIYGADGAESDAPSEAPFGIAPCNSAATRALSCDLDDNNVCPWDSGPPTASTSGPALTGVGTEQESSSGPASFEPLSTTMGTTTTTSTGRPHHHSASSAKDLSPVGHQRFSSQSNMQTTVNNSTRPSSAREERDRSSGGLTRESSRSSRRGNTATGEHHHRHHEHHHHHDHHHSASKRPKSKSKRKKSSRSKTGPPGSVGSTGTSSATSGPDKENVGISSTAEMLAVGTAALMSTAATSVAAAAAASSSTAETDKESPKLAAAPTTEAVESAPSMTPLRPSSSVDLPPSTVAMVGSSTSSKCTQTKLEAGGSDQALQRSLDRGTSGLSKGGKRNSQDLKENKNKLGEWKSMDELASSSMRKASMAVDLTGLKVAGMEEGGAAKGEKLRGSSTEVCPWEDE